MESDVTNDQLDELANQCAEQEDKGGSKYPGMSYEQGIKALIEWLRGEGPHPLED
jgi:hypothetical protein